MLEPVILLPISYFLTMLERLPSLVQSLPLLRFSYYSAMQKAIKWFPIGVLCKIKNLFLSFGR